MNLNQLQLRNYYGILPDYRLVYIKKLNSLDFSANAVSLKLQYQRIAYPIKVVIFYSFLGVLKLVDEYLFQLISWSLRTCVPARNFVKIYNYRGNDMTIIHNTNFDWFSFRQAHMSYDRKVFTPFSFTGYTCLIYLWGVDKCKWYILYLLPYNNYQADNIFILTELCRTSYYYFQYAYINFHTQTRVVYWTDCEYSSIKAIYYNIRHCFCSTQQFEKVHIFRRIIIEL